ncbi:hypothetical protein ACFQZT_22275 [Paenibacillus sp. GCM10027628]|uniref:hypothetical protein n=1 Tax=Paenibacillus sp. GCM10027628 TaxID=3273413 RepID=UPI003644308B
MTLIRYANDVIQRFGRKSKWKRVNSDIFHRYRVEKGSVVSQSEAIAMFFIATDVRQNGI